MRASLDECEASSSRCRGLASSIESTSLGLTATNGGDSQGGKDPSDRSPSVTTAVATWWPRAGRFRWLPAEDLLTFVRFPSGPAPHQEGSCKQAPSVRVVNYLGLCLVGTASQSCRPAPPLHPWTRGDECAPRHERNMLAGLIKCAETHMSDCSHQPGRRPQPCSAHWRRCTRTGNRRLNSCHARGNC